MVLNPKGPPDRALLHQDTRGSTDAEKSGNGVRQPVAWCNDSPLFMHATSNDFQVWDKSTQWPLRVLWHQEML